MQCRHSGGGDSDDENGNMGGTCVRDFNSTEQTAPSMPDVSVGVVILQSCDFCCHHRLTVRASVNTSSLPSATDDA